MGPAARMLIPFTLIGSSLTFCMWWHRSGDSKTCKRTCCESSESCGSDALVLMQQAYSRLLLEYARLLDDRRL